MGQFRRRDPRPGRAGAVVETSDAQEVSPPPHGPARYAPVVRDRLDALTLDGAQQSRAEDRQRPPPLPRRIGPRDRRVADAGHSHVAALAAEQDAADTATGSAIGSADQLDVR